jgi:polar amino acid transport system substrate-binding protein
VLRVGVTPNMPPLIDKAEGEMTGLEAEFARALGDRLGKPVRFVEVPWPRQIDALLSGKTDIIMSGMSITPARNARIAFTDPYLQVGQTALVRGEDMRKYMLPGSPFYLEARYGVEKGTTGDMVVRQRFPDAERVAFEDPRKGAAAVASGQIDVFVHDAPVAWWLASAYEEEGLRPAPFTFTVEYLAWGVSPRDGVLLKETNAMLDEWQEDGRLSETILRWIPYARP